MTRLNVTTMNDTTTPGEALYQLRKKAKLTLRRSAQLSEGAISHSHLNDLEKGLASWDELSFARIRGLARAYGVTPARLVELVEGRQPAAYEGVRLLRLRVVKEGGDLPGGSGRQESTITLALPELEGRDEAELFAVILKDDAMTGYAPTGSTVVFDYEGHPQNGDVVALELPGCGLTIRRLRGFSEAGRYIVSADGTGEVTETPKNSRIWGTALGVWQGEQKR